MTLATITSICTVLWELFSLGKVPYPGMSLSDLISELQQGYRMNKPQFATNEIGQLMAKCSKLQVQHSINCKRH